MAEVQKGCSEEAFSSLKEKVLAAERALIRLDGSQDNEEDLDRKRFSQLRTALLDLQESLETACRARRREPVIHGEEWAPPDPPEE